MIFVEKISSAIEVRLVEELLIDLQKSLSREEFEFFNRSGNSSLDTIEGNLRYHDQT